MVKNLRKLANLPNFRCTSFPWMFYLIKMDSWDLSQPKMFEKNVITLIHTVLIYIWTFSEFYVSIFYFFRSWYDQFITVRTNICRWGRGHSSDDNISVLWNESKFFCGYWRKSDIPIEFLVAVKFFINFELF